jgi:hypothetical protein
MKFPAAQTDTTPAIRWSAERRPIFVPSIARPRC